MTRPPTITATYEQGDIIDVMVNLTANHGGFFVFQLCPADDPLQEVDEDCLNDNNLEIVREQPVEDSVANSIETNLGVLKRAERNESEMNGERNRSKAVNDQRNESQAINGEQNETKTTNGERNRNKTTNDQRNDIDDSSLLTNLTDSSYESFDSLEAIGELNNTGNTGDLVNDEFGNVGQGSGEVGNEIDLQSNTSLLIKTVRRYNLFNPVDLDDHTYDRFKFPVPFESPRSYTIKVKLSNEISCERCVLRWIYVGVCRLVTNGPKNFLGQSNQNLITR